MGCVKSKGRIQTTQSTNSPKDDVRRCGRFNDRMTQNIYLIWLDRNINEKNSDCQNTITQLRHVVNTINTFTDVDKCIQFFDDVADEKACMIISGSLAQQIVSRVHNLFQVDSIFIFCNNPEYHKRWVQDWSKIKGIFTEIRSICDALKQTVRQCEQNAISISVISSDTLDPSFMYTQIMKEIFLTIKFKQQHIDEFIKHCRGLFIDNLDELHNVDKFAEKYRNHTPIWWYNCECFLYPMLNRILRMMDVDAMVKIGFFIADLHRHIEQLYQKQFESDGFCQQFIVYRGQGIQKDAFQKIVANKDGLISFNCFLSTSKNRSISLEFAENALTNDQLVGVLFVMSIDSKQSSTPFASTANVGYYGNEEDEVLFSMNSVFRIGEIKPINDNTRLFQIQLNLTSDKDNNLCELTTHIREETFPDTEGWYRLGLILWKMGKPATAQKLYEILLKEKSDESAKAPIYDQLGLIKRAQGEYMEAVAYYEKFIQIKENQIPRDDLELAKAYNNNGIAYDKMGDYPKALSYYEKALAIQQQSVLSTHPELAVSYNNIGGVYFSMGDYLKALAYYDKTLIIQQQYLPPTHLDLAKSYNNIGGVYFRMDDHPKALSSFEKVLAIRQQSLPLTHHDLAKSYNNIGSVYDSMGNYLKALTYYEKVLVIRQQSLPSTHPDLAKSYIVMGLVYDSIGDYSNALSHYEQALAIDQQTLPPTHPDLAMIYSNIGILHEKMNNYSKAYTYLERAVNIGKVSLSASHPEFQQHQNDLARIKMKL